MSEDALILSHDESEERRRGVVPPPPRFSRPWWYLAGLKCGIGYGLLSIVTLPFANMVWLGEVPLLALVQAPKLWFADWWRSDVVMPLIKSLGYSKGSFSPDYLMARPYGLGLAYSVPLILCGLAMLLPGCGTSRHRRALIILATVMVVDCLGTWFLADRRSLSMY